MPLRYLVNEKVVFDPQISRLWPAEDPDAAIALFVPASQCFVLLLQNKGNVLSQQFLFQEVWEKNGLYANANTLYQNIAVLRKSLKAAGLEDDVIRTVPRQGFSFTGEAEVQQQKSEESVIQEGKTEESKATHDETVPVSPFATLARIDKNLRIDKLFLPLLIGLVSFGVIVWLLSAPYYEIKSMQARYFDMGIVDNCRLYSNWQGKYDSTIHFRQVIQAAKEPCRPGEYAYLTFINHEHTTSVVKCNQPVTVRNAVCTVLLEQVLPDETK